MSTETTTGTVEDKTCTCCGEEKDDTEQGCCSECYDNGATYCTICKEWNDGELNMCVHLFYYDTTAGFYWGTGSDHASEESHKEPFFRLLSLLPGFGDAVARTLRQDKLHVSLWGSCLGWESVNCYLSPKEGEPYGREWGDSLVKQMESEVFIGHIQYWQYPYWYTRYNHSFPVFDEDAKHAHNVGFAWLIGLRADAVEAKKLTLQWLENEYPAWLDAHCGNGEGI